MRFEALVTESNINICIKININQREREWTVYTEITKKYTSLLASFSVSNSNFASNAVR